jgi:hypothetical protein
MKIGFTGTRNGLTRPQWKALLELLNKINNHDHIEEAHHGAAIGADAEFVMALMWLSLQADSVEGEGVKIHAHPCDLANYQDMISLYHSHVKYDGRDPLERNKDIVNRCDLLIACPFGDEIQRSGTWSTVRYARTQGKMIRIIMPDGEVRKEP